MAVTGLDTVPLLSVSLAEELTFVSCLLCWCLSVAVLESAMTPVAVFHITIVLLLGFIPLSIIVCVVVVR